MSREITLQLNPDNQSLEFSGKKLKLKISSKANNGLSFTNGKIVATKAPDGQSGSGGTMNTPGNAIGPTSTSASDSLANVGFNSTVSRHKKYTGDNVFLKNNDGPVMTKNNGTSMVVDGSIAAYMIKRATGG